jgi:hypothetical protein
MNWTCCSQEAGRRGRNIGGRRSGGLEIVMTDKLTAVSGRVVDARGRPLTD